MKIDLGWIGDMDIDDDTIVEAVKNTNLLPEQVFDKEDLESWAEDNNFVKSDE